MIDIVIVNWNSGDYLFKCIQSVFTKNNESIIGKVFIIDNNSSDDSLKKIGKNNRVVILYNQENKGFSKACNQGFTMCTSPYVLLLNPDTQLFDSTLPDCISFMNRTNDADILGCQLLNDDGKVTRSCARFPNPLRIFYDAIGLSKMAPKVFTPAFLMTDWDHKSSKYVDQVMGAFMFMRTSIFEKLGYFDEQFFVYFEELDFSKRLAEQGGKTYFNHKISATHSGEGTTYSVKAFRLFLNLRSRLQYSKKHFSYPGYVFVWYCTFFIEPFTRTFFLLLKGNFKEIKKVIEGYRFLLANRKNKRLDDTIYD
ncbi:MAG: glycosyltransferase family 2 protein [Ginsengibacter sp.]